MAVELPEPIDIRFLQNMNPPIQGSMATARVVNQIIDYLRSLESSINAIKSFSKPIDEMVDRKLGPHPDFDPEITTKSRKK